MSTRVMRIAASVLVALGALGPGATSAATPIGIYGAWQCSHEAFPRLAVPMQPLRHQ